MFYIDPTDVPVFLLCASSMIVLVLSLLRLWREVFSLHKEHGFEYKFLSMAIAGTIFVLLMLSAIDDIYQMYTAF